MILWLDDIRQPWRHGYITAVWVRSAEEAIFLLRGGDVTFASLDHDLSEQAALGHPAKGEQTGYNVVSWLEEHPQYWPKDGVRVHSLNPEGRERMLHVVERHYGRTFQK